MARINISKMSKQAVDEYLDSVIDLTTALYGMYNPSESLLHAAKADRDARKMTAVILSIATESNVAFLEGDIPTLLRLHERFYNLEDGRVGITADIHSIYTDLVCRNWYK